MHLETPNPSATVQDLGDVVSFLGDLPKTFPTLFPKKNTGAWLLRNRHTNGLAPYIHFVGRQAFISKSDFANWFRSQPADRNVSDAQRVAARTNVSVARAATRRTNRSGV
jgi:hypothetical protein